MPQLEYCSRCATPIREVPGGVEVPQFCYHCGAHLKHRSAPDESSFVRTHFLRSEVAKRIGNTRDQFKEAFLNEPSSTLRVEKFWPPPDDWGFSRNESLVLLSELLVIELTHLRQRDGEPPSWEVYAKRFPDCESILREAFRQAGITPNPASNPHVETEHQLHDATTKADPKPMPPPPVPPKPAHPETLKFDGDAVPNANPKNDEPPSAPREDSASCDPPATSEKDARLTKISTYFDLPTPPPTGNPETGGPSKADLERDSSLSWESSSSSIRQLGQYRIERSLGRGGFSEVYLAYDSRLQRRVAIKVCDVASQGRDDRFHRFLREARIGARLDHPNLCHIIDVQREDGVFYIVMEYVEGRDLSVVLDESAEPLPLVDACRYGIQLIEVLKFLSRHNVVHRDIKPSNLMVRNDQSLKLLDLGLGKSLNTPDESDITHEGAVMGTPHFMPPEQCEGFREVTSASDVYSAGATLYNLVTKHFPFGKASGGVFGVLMAIRQELPEDPRTYRPDLPDDLAQLILRMLAKRPRDRPDHDSILNVLRQYAQGDIGCPAETRSAPLTENISSPEALESAVMAESPRKSLLNFLNRAADESLDSERELMRLLPEHKGQVYLGEYVLKKPLGRSEQHETYNTYLGTMPFGEVDCFIRILPLEISKLPPEPLQHYLTEHGRLMKISARSAHLSGITFLGRAELQRSFNSTVYYTVEPWIPGTSLQTIIQDSEELSHPDAQRYLAQALAGLAALHEEQYLHGNLHPAKLLLDEQARELWITDLTQSHQMASGKRDGELTETRSLTISRPDVSQVRLERRQYEAPELFVSNKRPSPTTEQYALGVIFIEALTSHIGYVESARENLEHFLKAREDLEDRLDEISGESPILAQVLWKMVKLNPRSRFANLREARNSLLRADQKRKRKRPWSRFVGRVPQTRTRKTRPAKKAGESMMCLSVIGGMEGPRLPAPCSNAWNGVVCGRFSM